MKVDQRQDASSSLKCHIAAFVLILSAGIARGETTLLAWDVSDEDLWSVDTATPLTGTYIGGGNSSFIAEIEYGFGVVFGANTFPGDSNLKMIDPSTGQIFDTTTLTYPAEGNVITALEFVDSTLYAGLTTRGGGATYLATLDLNNGSVSVIGDTGVDSPFGGLAHDIANGTLYAISSGGSDAELFTVDTGSGLATSLGQVSVEGMSFQATALEFGDDGVLYAAANMSDMLFGNILIVDPTTALGTDLGAAGMDSGPVALTFMGAAIMAGDFETGTTLFWSETVQ